MREFKRQERGAKKRAHGDKETADLQVTHATPKQGATALPATQKAMQADIGYQMFVRTDREHGINPLPNSLNTSPAGHMNYDGNHHYDKSGYLSLFKYDPSQKNVHGVGNNVVSSAYKAIKEIDSQFTHFFFIKDEVQEVTLLDENVHSMPSTRGEPTLFNTDELNPPSLKNEDGETLQHAGRYIHEYLFSGELRHAGIVLTQKTADSDILMKMKHGWSVLGIVNSIPREELGDGPALPSKKMKMGQ
ncbi:hypothetical protein [Shewanella sp. YLB-07]|uniref:hypothetical protein n=1 Tax=Shewanella sp. YLB-07 TaxID=2601268 RepID=UPI00128AE460|nr:hypothetical protein [Shewanella sp. YLB-07]MPY24372.1 hypothetical protein [Shewanella sp. YLB-07]